MAVYLEIFTKFFIISQKVTLEINRNLIAKNPKLFSRSRGHVEKIITDFLGQSFLFFGVKNINLLLYRNVFILFQFKSPLFIYMWKTLTEALPPLDHLSICLAVRLSVRLRRTLWWRRCWGTWRTSKTSACAGKTAVSLRIRRTGLWTAAPSVPVR